MTGLEILITNKEISENLLEKLPEKIYKVIIMNSKKINLNPLKRTYNINYHSELQIEYLSIIPKFLNNKKIIELISDRKRFFEMEKDFAYLNLNDKNILTQYSEFDEFLKDYLKH